MQFGIEGSSKKLLSNIDPLDKKDDNGVSFGGLKCLRAVGGTPNVDLRTDKRPICLLQFIGFLGGGAGVKYIDTQLTGAVKITFDLAPAASVLFRAEASTTINGLPVRPLIAGNSADPANVVLQINANALIPDCAGVLAPSYSLAKLYATIKKYQIACQKRFVGYDCNLECH